MGQVHRPRTCRRREGAGGAEKPLLCQRAVPTLHVPTLHVPVRSGGEPLSCFPVFADGLLRAPLMRISEGPGRGVGNYSILKEQDSPVCPRVLLSWLRPGLGGRRRSPGAPSPELAPWKPIFLGEERHAMLFVLGGRKPISLPNSVPFTGKMQPPGGLDRAPAAAASGRGGGNSGRAPLCHHSCRSSRLGSPGRSLQALHKAPLEMLQESGWNLSYVWGK